MSQSPVQFQTWQGHRYAYEILGESGSKSEPNDGPALLLIHPIGVGLSRRFWDRFNQAWLQASDIPIYNPDLLGCGESDLPKKPYRPVDWAEQLEHFLETVVRRPTVVVAQGALAPAAIELCRLQEQKIAAGQSYLRRLVFSGPPAWRLMTNPPPDWQKNLAWSLFSSPFGAAFYRSARRRQFLESFSRKQLFASNAPIDDDWIKPLLDGAQDPATRHAVFAFLSRFWQQDYGPTVASISLPTLVVFGDEASSISRDGKRESVQDRLNAYIEAFPQGQGEVIPGRNVLPFESTDAFVETLESFVRES